MISHLSRSCATDIQRLKFDNLALPLSARFSFFLSFSFLYSGCEVFTYLKEALRADTGKIEIMDEENIVRKL